MEEVTWPGISGKRFLMNIAGCRGPSWVRLGYKSAWRQDLPLPSGLWLCALLSWGGLCFCCCSTKATLPNPGSS